MTNVMSDSSVITDIRINVAEQSLRGFKVDGEEIYNTQIATAKNGIGQLSGSECTPLGNHRIRAKIGESAPINSVFIGRRATGEIYDNELASANPARDWILTRILWLCGNEPGFNRGGNVDTQRRYIYIHGAPDSHPMGVPSSHGCIKMRNTDIIQLFNHVVVGTTVTISE